MVFQLYHHSRLSFDGVRSLFAETSNKQTNRVKPFGNEVRSHVYLVVEGAIRVDLTVTDPELM